MNFLLTDDEPLQLQELTSILRRIRPEAQVFAYTWPDDALEGAKSNSIDVAFLDIQTGGMSGLELALELKKIQPGVHIIFVTGFSQYAVDAFAMHASGYLLKPATEEAVLRELTFLYQERETGARVRVKTFGGFDVYVDGEPLRFGRAKSKELFAYLVDRRGSSVTTATTVASRFSSRALRWNSSTSWGASTTAMRSWLSEMASSVPSRPSYFLGTWFRSI